ncbi:MAG: zinc-dependent alcohol dehydrogenase [Phycisphaerae bacterium]
MYTKLNGLSLQDVPVPELPGPDWVRVRTLMGGICGTDLAIIGHKQPPDSILQAFSSMPMLLGHENVAEVEETGPDVDQTWAGKRVLVEPTLSCRVRGIDPPCAPCSRGEYGACENFGADGEGSAGLPPGSSIGYNSRTGGSYGEYFVAHESQLVEVPDKVSDEQAVLVDPVACSLHSALRIDLQRVRTVLIYGTGVLGLGTVACLRAMDFDGEIHCIGRGSQMRALAERFGADAWLELPADAKGRFEAIAGRTGASRHEVRFGNQMLSGGYDAIFDFVGSTRSINESLKWAAARGQVVLVATGSGGKVDLTPVWFGELSLVGAYGRQEEDFAGRRMDTYRLVLDLMTSDRLNVSDMLTGSHPLDDYASAFRMARNKSSSGMVKQAFDFRTDTPEK